MKLWQYITDAFEKRIRTLERKIGKMATQADVDALTARVTALETATDTLIQELKALIAAPGDISTADLDAAVTKFEADVANTPVP